MHMLRTLVMYWVDVQPCKDWRPTDMAPLSGHYGLNCKHKVKHGTLNWKRDQRSMSFTIVLLLLPSKTFSINLHYYGLYHPSRINQEKYRTGKSR